MEMLLTGDGSGNLFDLILYVQAHHASEGMVGVMVSVEGSL